jgi:pimeloyl-ACP methyl ester carboxylesterase
MMRCGFRVLDKTAPGLGGRWAYWLWFRTHRFPEPHREQRYRIAAQQIPFEHGGKSLAVYAWGEGPTVLITHGWNGRATQLWGFIDPLVEAGFRALGFDMPAHGHSAGKSTDLYKMAEAMRVVADEFGPVHGVIAHSLSNAALVMALRDGLNANKVVCISPPAHTTWMVKSYADALELSPKMQARLCELFERDYGTQVWKQTSAGENVNGLSVPALVIHDKDDHEVPWEQGEVIARNWPGARFLSTESLGHRRLLRNRQVIAETVEFLRPSTT